MKTTCASLLSAVFLAAALIGCATTEEGTASSLDVAPAASGEMEQSASMEPTFYPPPVPAQLNAVEFLDEEVKCRVIVQKTNYTRTPGNTFETMASFKNMTDKPIRLLARTQYFNADRMHQEGPTPWHMVYLPQNGIETYKSYSYAKDLEFYLIEVKELCE